MKKESVLDRVVQISTNENINITSLERKIGASAGVLSRAIRNKTDIQTKWIENIIENYPLYDANWLITGKGSMLKDQQSVLTVKANLEPEIKEDNSQVSLYKLKTDYYGIERQSIPLYEIEAAAGLATLFSSQNTQVPLDFISVPNAPKCDGAVSVRGDSMYPILKAGDLICYKTILNIDNIVFGEMYLLDIDNGDDIQLLVKFVQKSDKGDDYIRLVSENKYHAPKDIPISYIRALAIIKLSIRYNTIS